MVEPLHRNPLFPKLLGHSGGEELLPLSQGYFGGNVDRSIARQEHDTSILFAATVHISDPSLEVAPDDGHEFHEGQVERVHESAEGENPEVPPNGHCHKVVSSHVSMRRVSQDS